MLKGSNMLDLVFTTEPGLIEDMVGLITAPVTSCDHNLLNFKVIWKREEIIHKNDCFNYLKYWDYVPIRKMLANPFKEEKFEGKTEDEMWNIFRDDLIGIRDKLIPKRKMSRRSFPLWMKFKIKKWIKKRNKTRSNFNKCSSYQNK